MSILCFRLYEIPDITLNKYQSLADTGIDGVLKRHEDFLRQWHGICLVGRISMHLLYIYNPDGEVGHRIIPYFFLQGTDDALSLVKPLLNYSPISDFFDLVEAPSPNFKFTAGATLTKKERVAEIYNNLSGQVRNFHYVPNWEVTDACRLYDLFRMLEAIGKSYPTHPACAFRLDIYSVEQEQKTRISFTPTLRELRGDNDIKITRDSPDNRDDYATDVGREYEEWLESVETTPHFQVNMYAFAEDLFQAKVLLNAAASEAIEEGDFSIAPIKPDSNGEYSAFSRMNTEAAVYCFYPACASLPEWSTTYLLNEVVPFFRLPVLYDGESIEIPKETAPAFVQSGLYIGQDDNGYPVNFPIADLPRHAFFTGTPGSGKTNTMLHLVTELKKKGIPFLALEPAKKEYRALLGTHGMEDVHLFSPHLQSRFPLQINPFEFPKGVRLSEHINALLEVFQGSFALEGPTYKFLSSSIQTAYENLGWDIEDTNTEDADLPYPSIQDIYNNLEKEIEQSSYDAELKGNVRAFLQVRLGGLMERDAGELFNAPISTLRPEEWLTNSAIVELEVLNEQAKNFFVLLVCHYILETLRVDPNGGIDMITGAKMPVRHVIFIEEAHNIIAPSTEQASSDSVDPKISATAYIVKMLAEVRALRESIIIADQLPTALATEVTKNTGLKLVHRLTAQDDREQIGAAISATPLQLEQVSTFTKGKALIYYEKTQKPFQVQVAEWKTPKLPFDFANDEALFNHVLNRDTVATALYAAFDNWKEKWLFPLEDKIAEWFERYLALVSLSKSDAVLKSELIIAKHDLIKECRHRIRKLQKLAHLWNIDQIQVPDIREAFAEVLDELNKQIIALEEEL